MLVRAECSQSETSQAEKSHLAASRPSVTNGPLSLSMVFSPHGASVAGCFRRCGVAASHAPNAVRRTVLSDLSGYPPNGRRPKGMYVHVEPLSLDRVWNPVIRPPQTDEPVVRWSR